MAGSLVALCAALFAATTRVDPETLADPLLTVEAALPVESTDVVGVRERVGDTVSGAKRVGAVFATGGSVAGANVDTGLADDAGIEDVTGVFEDETEGMAPSVRVVPLDSSGAEFAAGTASFAAGVANSVFPASRPGMMCSGSHVAKAAAPIAAAVMIDVVRQFEDEVRDAEVPRFSR